MLRVVAFLASAFCLGTGVITGNVINIGIGLAGVVVNIVTFMRDYTPPSPEPIPEDRRAFTVLTISSGIAVLVTAPMMLYSIFVHPIFGDVWGEAVFGMVAITVLIFFTKQLVRLMADQYR